MPARWRRFGEKGKKRKNFQRRPMPKPEVELRNWNDVPVDSVRVRNWRKFGVAATRAGRYINEKRNLVLAHCKSEYGYRTMSQVWRFMLRAFSTVDPRFLADLQACWTSIDACKMTGISRLTAQISQAKHGPSYDRSRYDEYRTISQVWPVVVGAFSHLDPRFLVTL